MITEEPAKPAEHLVRKLVEDAETVARRDPTKAVAAAFGIGVLINVLPTRFIVGTIATVATTVVRPTLMTLGVIKAFEIYLDQTKKSNSKITLNLPSSHDTNP